LLESLFLGLPKRTIQREAFRELVLHLCRQALPPPAGIAHTWAWACSTLPVSGAPPCGKWVRGGAPATMPTASC
jgi:hypothetical protein